ncbi:shikimate dehydrogenase [bacterium]|nr:MAG: shikimate dehydrogenase [bacterium]
MDRYAVIGHPVAHSRSPFIHERFAKQTSQSMSYARIEAGPAIFEKVVRHFFAQGGRGVNVTLPHKQTAAVLSDALTPRARVAGAVNTLALQPDGTLLGDNTDGPGLVRDLRVNLGIAIAGRRVLLLGAGGAARGVLAPLLGLQPAFLTLANRTPERARELAAAFATHGDCRGCGFEEVLDGPYDLVVNATSASLAGESLPLARGTVGTHSVCYDMAYGPDDTPFVRWAQAQGATRTAMGLGMLVEQAAESFHLWRGVRPDTASVLAALKVELRAA